MNEHDTTVRNKARSVVQEYNQQEGIDYEEILAPYLNEKP